MNTSVSDTPVQTMPVMPSIPALLSSAGVTLLTVMLFLFLYNRVLNLDELMGKIPSHLSGGIWFYLTYKFMFPIGNWIDTQASWLFGQLTQRVIAWARHHRFI